MRRSFTTSVWLGFALLCSACMLWQQNVQGGIDPHAAAIPVWEYRLVPLRPVPDGKTLTREAVTQYERDFNSLGRMGWELVSVGGDMATFKRLVP